MTSYDIILYLTHYSLYIVYLLPPNSQNQLGEHLIEASRHGDVKNVTELLKYGVPINWRNRDEWTALHAACAKINSPEVVKVLLMYDPNVNQQTCHGHTPAHIACHWGFVDCLKLLLATGQCDLG